MTATSGICSNFPLKQFVNFLGRIYYSICLEKIACVIQGNYIKTCTHSTYLLKHTLSCIFKMHLLGFFYLHLQGKMSHSSENIYSVQL